ncbi:MAG: OmpA family protein [Candidatus Omnitrophica bacterium]|nr:OmpA family protein [Candidatus Omnitrophota bacterium]
MRFRKILLVGFVMIVAGGFVRDAGAVDFAEHRDAEATTSQTYEKPSIIDPELRAEMRKAEYEEHAKKFEWWPSDAKPAPVKDEEKGGYWWYPDEPGQARPWGNRGYIYVYKIIFDYKSDELPPPQPGELRPSLLVRKIIKNVKVYFDYDKDVVREDAKVILDAGVRTLSRNSKASVLITGNADVRGTEEYNLKLAASRAESVARYLASRGVTADRIRFVSRGKLDAVAPVTDLVGMQRDRNAQFVVAEVEEVMMPYQGPPPGVDAKQINEDVYLVEEKENLESTVQVSEREYTIKQGDTLSKIAKEQLGNGNRWRFLYQYNKDRIKNPDKLIPGRKIKIPVE